MKERVKQFIEAKGLSQARFEKQAGLANGAVNGMIHGLGTKNIERVLEAFPELSRVWLLTGEGEMLNPEAHVTRVSINKNSGDTAVGGTNGSPATINKGTDENYQQMLAEMRERFAALEEQLRVKDEQLKAKDAQLASLHDIMAKLLER